LSWLVVKAAATDGNLPSGRQGSPIGAAGGHPRLPRLDSPIATPVPRDATYDGPRAADTAAAKGGQGKSQGAKGHGERWWNTIEGPRSSAHCLADLAVGLKMAKHNYEL
jgi:hypothetical protein